MSKSQTCPKNLTHTCDSQSLHLEHFGLRQNITDLGQLADTSVLIPALTSLFAISTPPNQGPQLPTGSDLSPRLQLLGVRIDLRRS